LNVFEKLRRRAYLTFKGGKGVGIIFSFYSDFGLCVVRPVRLERSVKSFPHWPTEATGSPIPITSDLRYHWIADWSWFKKDYSHWK